MSLMANFLPRYQFSARGQTMVRCRPGELLDVIQDYQPPRDRLGDLLMSARELPAKLLHRAAPSRRPPPRPFTVRTFVPLGRDGDREIVAGLVGRLWRPDFGLVPISGPAEFIACNPPRTAKLVIGFRAEPVGDATRLTTETRVYCPDRYALIMFTPYWLLIHPASALLRQRGLRTIRALAEARAAASHG